MNIGEHHSHQIASEGFTIIEHVFSDEEIDQLLFTIGTVDTTNPSFRKTADLFAIRQFLKEVPKAANIIFNKILNDYIQKIMGDTYFVVKSIYFDKPESSNWFVAYHQDLTISVNKKVDLEGYGPWTVKQNQFAVQPPLSILQDNLTIRIHLDDTTAHNGALKIIPQSHLKGVYRPETIDWLVEKEVIGEVPKGGIMIMKPLLLHASSRSTKNQKRRVIHIELSRTALPNELQWSEFLEI
jgi:ectoine hydroxylase-related dioxygenase (phytanoyl-CoA dioxygenase family)